MEQEYINENFMSDEDLGIENEDVVIYPIDRDKIQVTVNNNTIFSIIQLIIRWDIELQPNFQRSYVWDDSKAEKFIDSIWNWLPIPQLFLLTKKDWTQFVIDGQQRLTSLIRFMLSENELKKVLPDTAFGSFNHMWWLQLKVKKSIFTNNKDDEDIKVTFDELDLDMKRKFEWESLIVAQIKPTYSLFKWKDEDLEKISKEIFYRLNTGWVKLTPHEIRHSLYNKKFMQRIKEVSFSDNWLNLIPGSIRKFKDEPSLWAEMLLRAFALLDVYWTKSDVDTIWKIDDIIWYKFEYFKPLNVFLDKYAWISDKFDEKYINDRINLLNLLIEKLNIIFQDQTLFRHSNIVNHKTWKSLSKSFNIKYVDTLFVWLLNLFRFNKDNDIDLNKLKDYILTFKEDFNFIENHISKTWSAEPNYVQGRVVESINYFNNFNK